VDPQRVARFWSALLDREPGPSQDGWVYLGHRGDPQPRLVFQPVPEPKAGKRRTTRLQRGRSRRRGRSRGPRVLSCAVLLRGVLSCRRQRTGMATGANDSSGPTASASWVRSPGPPVSIPGSPSRSARVPTVTGHGLHCDARDGEELTDLGGVLNDVQRHAADNHREHHAVVSMGVRKWPSGRLLGEAVKGLADAAAAPVDVPDKLGLSEPAVWGRRRCCRQRLWRCPTARTRQPGHSRALSARGSRRTREPSRVIPCTAPDP
jgi:hypothetical protein